MGNDHLKTEFYIGLKLSSKLFIYIYFTFYSGWSRVSLCVCMCHICFPVPFLTAVVWWLISPHPQWIFVLSFHFCLSAFNLSSVLGATAGCGSVLVVTETQLFLLLSPCWAAGFIGVWVFGFGHGVRPLKEQFGRSGMLGTALCQLCWAPVPDFQSLPFASVTFSKSSCRWHETPLF